MQAYDLIMRTWDELYFSLVFRANREKLINSVNQMIIYFLVAPLEKNEFLLSIGKFFKRAEVKGFTPQEIIDSPQLDFRDQVLIIYRQFYREMMKLNKQGIQIGTQNQINMMKIESECFLNNMPSFENKEFVKLFEEEFKLTNN